MLSPSWDAGFAESKMHGIVAQRVKFDAALKLCKHRRRAVDVGAHVGLWTSMLQAAFKDVWAFEPQLENFSLLRRNLHGTHPTPQLINVALGAVAARCDMRLPADGNSGCWYAVPGKETRVATLDSYKLGQVGLLKIDVEGLEGSVLLGAVKTLKNSSPVVIFEDNGLGVEHYGAAWVDPKLVLAANGYVRADRVHKDEIWHRA